MKARQMEDRQEFIEALGRVSPKFVAEWRALAAREPSRGEVRDFLAHALRVEPPDWIVDDFWIEAESDAGLPGDLRAKFEPDDGLPGSSGDVPEHEFEPLAWQPGESGETAAEFRARVETYIAHVEAWMSEAGLEMPRRQHDRGETEAGEHRWDLLASKLALGWTDEQIGHELGISKQAAGKHIRVLADRLGIALRVRQPTRRP